MNRGESMREVQSFPAAQTAPIPATPAVPAENVPFFPRENCSNSPLSEPVGQRKEAHCVLFNV